MSKDRPTGGFRFKKRVPIIKLPFGLGDIKLNLSMSHGIESITAQGKLGKLQSNINYNLHKKTVQGLTSVSGTGLSKQYTLQNKEQSKSKPKEDTKDAKA